MSKVRVHRRVIIWSDFRQKSFLFGFHGCNSLSAFTVKDMNSTLRFHLGKKLAATLFSGVDLSTARSKTYPDAACYL